MITRKTLAQVVENPELAINGSGFELIALANLGGLDCKICGLQPVVLVQTKEELGTSAWCREVGAWLETHGWTLENLGGDFVAVEMYCPDHRP